MWTWFLSKFFTISPFFLRSSCPLVFFCHSKAFCANSKIINKLLEFVRRHVFLTSLRNCYIFSFCKSTAKFNSNLEYLKIGERQLHFSMTSNISPVPLEQFSLELKGANDSSSIFNKSFCPEFICSSHNEKRHRSSWWKKLSEKASKSKI